VNGFRAWFLPPHFSLSEREILAGTWEGAESAEGPESGQGPEFAQGRESAQGLAPFLYPDLSMARLVEVGTELRKARESYLLTTPVQDLMEAVDRVAMRFLDGGDSLRSQALDGLGAYGGYSRPMARTVLEGMARGWTGEMLGHLVRSEFADPRVLDTFVPDGFGGRVRALGYPLTFHLGAGSVPGVATTSLIRALLVKSAVLMKPGFGDLALPVLFASGLAHERPDLSRAVAVLYWPGQDTHRTEAALDVADLVVAYAGNETIEWVRRRLPPPVPLRAYRHRMGFGLVGREALDREGGGDPARGPAWDAARGAAWAVAAFDQRGCVSPHVLFVEEGGRVGPEEFSELLSRALHDLEVRIPAGRRTQDEWGAMQQLRGEAEMKEALGSGRVFHGGESSSWSVFYSPDGEIEPSCLGRAVRVLPVKEVGDGLERMAQWRPYLQTVGFVGFEDRIEDLQEDLARLGVSRIVGMAQVPWPRPWWHHDGTGPLRDLVLWTDVEDPGGLSPGGGEG